MTTTDNSTADNSNVVQFAYTADAIGDLVERLARVATT
jgi:hypothetical protein